jgi:cytochrome c551/c552
VHTMTNGPTSRGPVYIALLLLGLVIAAFGAAILSLHRPGDGSGQTLTSETYMDRVNQLLGNADPQRGDVLIDQYQCGSCHRIAAPNNIAPGYEDIAVRAATRRPPLIAPAYIYESIIHPAAFVVEGYVAAMPQNYAERLSDQELGDIIAYLLTPDAK